MTVLVAGGAGFIAANLIGSLLDQGQRVIAVDDLSRGAWAHLGVLRSHPGLRLLQSDLSRADCVPQLRAALATGETVDEVWHLAANSDIPAGVSDASIDLKNTFLTTFQLLEFMRVVGARRLVFASSSAIYGDFGEREITEDIGPLMPISNYGAMKLASEAQISAAAESFLDRAVIYRFPNVVGVPATHGVILDLVRKLKARPDELPVLGDGSQQKAYLHVTDLVDAMLQARQALPDKRLILNLGPVDAGVSVKWIAEQVAARVAPGATIRYGTGNRGWTGDVPRFRYSVARLTATGWAPRLDSRGAILRAVDEIARQEGC